MKYLHNYGQFKKEELTNEDLRSFFSSIKDKFKNIFSQIKGKSVVNLVSSIIPKELKDLIFTEAQKYDKVVNEELFDKTLFTSQEEIDKMSDEEYDKFLNEISKDARNNQHFVSSLKSNSEVSDFLTQKGIEVEQPLLIKTSPSLENITKKIDSMKLGPVGKKVLKGCCFILFFSLLLSKTASATTLHQNQLSVTKTKISADSGEQHSEGDVKVLSQDLNSTQPYSVVEVDGYKALNLKLKLQKNLNELRSDVQQNQISPITQLKFYPTGSQTEKIVGDIQFAIAPKGQNGITNAHFEIQIKDGKYKITITNISFQAVGEQPKTGGQQFVSKVKPIVGTGAATYTQRGVSSSLGGGQLAQVAGNVAAGAVQQAALSRPATPGNFNLVDVEGNGKYADYSQAVKGNCDYFFRLILNEFKPQDNF
jgi:hypothetical protein